MLLGEVEVVGAVRRGADEEVGSREVVRGAFREVVGEVRRVVGVSVQAGEVRGEGSQEVGVVGGLVAVGDGEGTESLVGKFRFREAFSGLYAYNTVRY